MALKAQFDVEFRKDGTIFDDGQVEKVLEGLAALTDLVVVSHGWNNDRAEAARLYDDLVTNIDRVAQADIVPGFKARQIGLVRVFWPSKKFADEDLIPGGGAASATAESDRALIRVLEELKVDPDRLGGSEVNAARATHVNRALAQVPALKTSPDAQREFVQALRAILNPDDMHRDDGSVEFFEAAPEKLFANLSGPVSAPAGPVTGGATSVSAGGAANVFGDLLDGATAAARRIANFATYYQMKTRAGTVGKAGVAILLARVRQQAPALPLTLVGHSFGGRLVTAAASTLTPGSGRSGMMLLQAAFSHNGFAEKFDGKNDGAFRTVVGQKRLSGPMLITHTKNDKAVGVAYPLASRIARDAAAALGDENDPYGGIGRNGAQRTPEVQAEKLRQLQQPYTLTDGKVFNLRADDFIKDHGDVTGPQVAYGLAHLVVHVGRT